MLRNAIEDINDKKRDYESIKRKHGRTNNTAQTHATDADKAKGDIEFYEKKIDETSKALVHAESNKKRYEGQIAKNEDAELLLNNIIKLENNNI